MGRIKTAMIKRITNRIVREHSSELKKDFNENKQVVSKLVAAPSKKIRNIIAGYATRQMKNREVQ